MRKTPKNPIVKKIADMIGPEYGAMKEFAAKADIDYHILRQNLYMDNDPTISMLISISRAHGVSLDELCADYTTERRFFG